MGSVWIHPTTFGVAQRYRRSGGSANRACAISSDVDRLEWNLDLPELTNGASRRRPLPRPLHRVSDCKRAWVRNRLRGQISGDGVEAGEHDARTEKYGPCGPA